MVSVENHIFTICGAALGAATGGVGHAFGFFSEIVRFDGTATGLGEHPETGAIEAPASSVKNTLRKGILGRPKDDRRLMDLMERPSPTKEDAPSTHRLDFVIEPAGAPSTLDWLIALAGVWIITGLFIDAHQHLFLAVESFLNPWHMTMYSGAVFAAVVMGVAIARKYRSAGSFWNAIPPGYTQSVLGVAALLLGGAMDFVWHAIFGFEHQLDLLFSPPHLFLLSGLFFLITGPVRSALRRPNASRLLDQLPMLVSFGLAFEIIQFVTQFGFYPEALLRDHPLSQPAFPREQFVLSVFLYYRQALELSIVVWQSVLLAAAVLYLCVRRRLHFGALIVISLAVKLWIGGELASDRMELLLLVLASISAGLAGDLIAAWLRPSAKNPNAFRLLGFVVPAAYFGAYFAFAVPMFGGTWWDASLVFGAIAVAGLVGLCISQLLLAGSQTSNNTA
jgi:hypothetical protein